MKARIKRWWLLISILLVICPMGLLAVFRVTGILPEPQTPETLTVDTVRWEIDRPSTDVNLRDRVENANTTDEASLGIGVWIEEYQENNGGWPYDGNDGVALQFFVNATVTQSFTASIAVKFYPFDSNAAIFISGQSVRNYNATVTDINAGTRGSEAYVRAAATDSSCYLDATAYWVFYDQNVEDHQLSLVLEFTYLSGSIYKKVVLPILLSMVLDVGETFGTAKHAMAGTYKGCLDQVEMIDMYAINVQEGQSINLTLKPPETANFDLYLYSLDEAEVASSILSGNATETITYTANSTGWWYIKVANALQLGFPAWGIYQLKIEVSTP